MSSDVTFAARSDLQNLSSSLPAVRFGEPHYSSFHYPYNLKPRKFCCCQVLRSFTVPASIQPHNIFQGSRLICLTAPIAARYVSRVRTISWMHAGLLHSHNSRLQSFLREEFSGLMSTMCSECRIFSIRSL